MIITTASRVTYGFEKFIESAKKHDWEVHIENNYVAYGSKQKNAFEYLVRNPGVKHAFILDSYDIYLIGNESSAIEIIKQSYRTIDFILFNAEKGCWPDESLKDKYPFSESEWKYLNGGACFVNAEMYKDMFSELHLKETDNDQEILSQFFVSNREKFNIKLDDKCSVFQSIAFEDKEDFNISEGLFYNKKNNSYPLIIHGNGRTDMSKIYNNL